MLHVSVYYAGATDCIRTTAVESAEIVLAPYGARAISALAGTGGREDLRRDLQYAGH